MAKMSGSESTTPRAPYLRRIGQVLTAPGGPYLVLRLFLGGTFVYAGLQKLTNRYFFTAANPGSIQVQLHASAVSSPIGVLIRSVDHAPVAVGLVIAIGELAAGLGTIVGLLGRVAAAGGMVISLSLFLAVSFHTTPYFYGSDIVFLFAWTPLLIGGSGAWSLDSYFEQRHRRDLGGLTVGTGAVDGDETSGAGAVGLAAAGDSYSGAVAAGASTLSASAPDARASAAAEIDRRAALRTTASAFILASFGAVVGGLSAAVGRIVPPGKGAGPGLPGSKPRGPVRLGKAIGKASSVPLGGAVQFTEPGVGAPAYLVHPHEASFVAFSAICTHAGCTVGFAQASLEFQCPCHGSRYSALTGQVLQGPAPLPLPQIAVTEAPDGVVYTEI